MTSETGHLAAENVDNNQLIHMDLLSTSFLPGVQYSRETSIPGPTDGPRRRNVLEIQLMVQFDTHLLCRLPGLLLSVRGLEINKIQSLFF